MEKYTVFIYRANLLDDNHNIEYNTFIDKFGEEENLIVVGVKDDSFFYSKHLLLE
jgi:hypothetical protein